MPTSSIFHTVAAQQEFVEWVNKFLREYLSCSKDKVGQTRAQWRIIRGSALELGGQGRLLGGDVMNAES